MRTTRSDLWLLFLALLGCAAFFLYIDLQTIDPLRSDDDDTIRRLQIQSLLNGQGWFDMRLSMIQMPEPYVSHYSRIVDVPYFVIANIVLFFGLGSNPLLLAETIWPPIMLIGFVLCMTQILSIVYGKHLSVLSVLLSGCVCFLSFWEFSPRRIDHHKVQLLLLAFMIYGLISKSPKLNFSAGAALCLSIAVGLEAVPFIVSAVLGLCICAIWRPAHYGEKLKYLGFGMVICALPTTIASYGPQIAMQTYCDAAAAPSLFMLMAGGTVLGIIPSIWSSTIILKRFIVLSIASMSVGLAAVMLWPECLSGPYAQLHPDVVSVWLSEIPQEQTIFNQPSSKLLMMILLAGPAILVLFPALGWAYGALNRGKYEAAIVVFMAVICYGLYFLIERTAPFVSFFTALLVPALLVDIKTVPKTKFIRARLIAGTSLGTYFLTMLAFAVVEPRKINIAKNLIAFDRCESGDLTVLEQVQAGRVIAPIGIGMRILENMPKFSVAGVGLHRSNDGILKIIQAFNAKTPQELSSATEGFDYLVVCVRSHWKPQGKTYPLLDRLLAEETVVGLVQIKNPTKSDLRLFKIVHDALM